MNSDIGELFNYQNKSPSTGSNSLLPDPFVMYSSTAYPRSIESVLRLCEYMWLHAGQFKMAMQRVVRYFLTKVEIDGRISDKEKSKYTEFLNDQLGIMNVLGILADDFICYGNSFSSLYLPFNRILFCTKCSLSRAMDNVKEFKFDSSKKQFSVYCPACSEKTIHTHKDIRSMDESRIRVIRWNPHEIQLTHDFLSGSTAFIWTITPDIKTRIKEGNPFYVKRMPWEVIEAVGLGTYFEFTDGIVHHMKEDTIAGVRNRGWGIPRVLALFKDIYYVQLLKRYNEALAMDYIVPFRVLSPQKGTSADPMMHYDMNSWSNSLQGMLAQHRKDPAGWHTVPFPINYQVLGGEGQALSPFQLIKQGTIDMMDAAGVPGELFQGTMAINSAPTALRLFQATWPQIPYALNRWLQWLVDKLSETFGWEKVKARLQPVAYADDLDRKGMLMQLAAGQQISQQTAFAGFGIDPMEETRRMLEETRRKMAIQREFEEQENKKQELQDTMSQIATPQAAMMQGQPGAMPMGAAQGGAPMQGGAPAGGADAPIAAGMPGLIQQGAGPGPVSPEQLLNQAQQIAQQLVATPETQRKSQMIQLKRTNPLLHSVVKQQMTNLTQQAASAGVDQMRQQAQGGGMPPM